MTNVDTLIDNGTVMTMDPGRRVLENASVAVHEGKIVEVGTSEEMRAKYTADKVINARRRMIMPGLVDLHAHAGTSLLKGIAEFLPGGHWRNAFDFIAYHTSKEWWYVESMLSALEKVKSGTTTSLYMLGCAPRSDNPEYAYKSAEGAQRLGARSVIGVGPSRPPWPKDYSYWEGGRRIDRMVSFEESLEGASEAIGTWNSRNDDRVRMWTSASRLLNPNPADPVFDEDNVRYARPQAEGIRRIMDEHDVGFTVHAYGTAVKFLEEEGIPLLGPKTVLAHCWPLDVESVDILARTDTRVAHCPRAHRVYQYEGRCPVPEMIDAGVTVGFGSDFCGLDRSWNLWEDIFFSPRLHRKIKHDANFMPVGKVLEMATIDGAKALGLDHRIGSIEPGKDADIIVVNLFKAHTVPFFMETQRLAYYGRGTDVETVMVQGDILMENREMKSVDEDEILRWAQEEAEQTVRMFNLEPLMEVPDRYWGHASL